MSFNPDRAVHIHTHGDRTLSLDTVALAEETGLLIHSVGFTADRQIKLRETDADGNLIFRADADPVLTWNVRATVLEWDGLADAHPGPLSREALIFANGPRAGARYPHKFRKQLAGEDVGILFYEQPNTEHEGGDTQEISFRIALEFSDLQTTTEEAWTVSVPGWTDPATTENSAQFLAFLALYPVDPPLGGPDGTANPRAYGYRPGWVLEAGETTLQAKGPQTMFYLDNSEDLTGLMVSVWAEDEQGNHPEGAALDSVPVNGSFFTVTVPTAGRYTLIIHTVA